MTFPCFLSRLCVSQLAPTLPSADCVRPSERFFAGSARAYLRRLVLNSICMKCMPVTAQTRAGPTQWVCVELCAGPNRLLLAWEMSSEWLTRCRLLPLL